MEHFLIYVCSVLSVHTTAEIVSCYFLILKAILKSSVLIEFLSNVLRAA